MWKIDGIVTSMTSNSRTTKFLLHDEHQALISEVSRSIDEAYGDFNVSLDSLRLAYQLKDACLGHSVAEREL
jgi:hypothetical protein